eukprot:CAMPEP_0113911030 /NCGR_PEP_ID=MMETSP0780_2-20120614/27921_1 /TAXON_ID=652834 /ORGANISM="Palpitomonas bilix" /LENGTH=32 /DNA_ID=CAMNT_0000907385 /DNA_START=56 /DNA_END=150 /DNA_ORIENTATION=+ /assembly_acc=CAM_ASM_000599
MPAISVPKQEGEVGEVGSANEGGDSNSPPLLV